MADALLPTPPEPEEGTGLTPAEPTAAQFTSLVPDFLEIVARFADTLVEMDLTTPAALSALASLAHAPGFARLAAAAVEAWAVQAALIQPTPLYPQAVRAIRDVRVLASHLDALLSYSKGLPVVQDALAGLWLDPTFAALCLAAQTAYTRQVEEHAF
jgi:hypothetical protein